MIGTIYTFSSKAIGKDWYPETAGLVYRGSHQEHEDWRSSSITSSRLWSQVARRSMEQPLNASNGQCFLSLHVLVSLSPFSSSSETIRRSASQATRSIVGVQHSESHRPTCARNAFTDLSSGWLDNCFLWLRRLPGGG